MAMHNPPHPGEFIREVYLEPLELSPRSLALRLGVAPSTFARLIKGRSSVSPESWLLMQDSYDLWQARSRVNLSGISPLTAPARALSAEGGRG